MSGPISIERLDAGDQAVRHRLVDFLAPHETRVMFILGNLRAGTPQTNLYLALRKDDWLGVAAYFGRYKSFVPFSLDADVTRLLTRHVAGIHPQIEWLNGMQEIAAPALEELLRLGYQAANDPRQVFMELDGLPPVQPWEPCCRLHRPEDSPAIVRLLRHLGGGDPDAPVAEQDLARVRANAQRWVLECEGQIVSTAATSGLAVEACQIIGVATDPRYRRRGFARSVCARLVRDMAGEGARRAVLFTPVSNTAAQRCYQGLGFRITGDYCLAKFTVAEEEQPIVRQESQVNGIEISRQAAPEEAPLLAAILRRSFQDVAQEFGLNPETFRWHPSNYQDQWVRDDMACGITFFVLEVKGLPAGCVGMTTPQDGACEMKRLGVLPEYRHKGLGKALVDHAIARATSLGLSRLNLDLIAANARLRRWYEGMGFVYTETRTVEGIPFEIGSMTLELL